MSTPDIAALEHEVAEAVERYLLSRPSNLVAWGKVEAAVTALREARKPKPRYRVLHAPWIARYPEDPWVWVVLDDHADSLSVAFCWTEESADLVSAALNMKEPTP